MGKRSYLLPIVTATALAVVLTACSSSKKDTGTGTGTTGGSSAATDTAAGGSAKIAEAQAVVDAAMKNPATIEITNKLSKVPPTGKFLVITSTSEPVTVVKNQAVTTAAKALGWRVQLLNVDNSAEGPGKALTQAVALKPDIILISGGSLPSLRSQLAAAKSANIPVLAESVTDPKIESVIDVSIDSTDQVVNVGKLMGNYIVAKSKGNANVAIFNLPIYGVLTSYSNAVKDTVTSLCPDCKAKVVDVQLSDFTKMGQVSTSAVQRDPKLNWLIYSIGDLSTGVPEALKAAGLADKVTLGGETPSTKNIADLKAGATSAWTGFSGPILGWRDVDMMARHFNGDPLTPGGKATTLPTQIITKDNVATIVVDSTGYYVGVEGYEAQFKALWGLS